MPPYRRLAVLPLAAALLVPLTGVAAAHVTVQPPTAEKGAYAKLTFRVPNEADTATTRLEVAFPPEHPFSSARVKPREGWAAEVTRAAGTDADGEPAQVVQRISWTATGAGIGPEEFDEFEVSLGPLPEDADTLAFPALQTYADGEVVRWIEPVAEGAPEPEKPAPTLTLVAATDTATDAHGAPATTETARTEPVSAVSSTDDGTDPVAVAALVVAGLALATGGYAAVRARAAR